MTQKEILLKDLSARLPHGVIVKDRNGTHKLTAGNTEFTDLLYNGKCNIKPYLFPLSSMTWKQECQYREVIASSLNHYEVYDWLNKNHFDYRELIEKGLAIDCTNLNIY